MPDRSLEELFGEKTPTKKAPVKKERSLEELFGEPVGGGTGTLVAPEAGPGPAPGGSNPFFNPLGQRPLTRDFGVGGPFEVTPPGKFGFRPRGVIDERPVVGGERIPFSDPFSGAPFPEDEISKEPTDPNALSKFFKSLPLGLAGAGVVEPPKGILENEPTADVVLKTLENGREITADLVLEAVTRARLRDQQRRFEERGFGPVTKGFKRAGESPLAEFGVNLGEADLSGTSIVKHMYLEFVGALGQVEGNLQFTKWAGARGLATGAGGFARGATFPFSLLAPDPEGLEQKGGELFPTLNLAGMLKGFGRNVPVHQFGKKVSKLLGTGETTAGLATRAAANAGIFTVGSLGVETLADLAQGKPFSTEVLKERFGEEMFEFLLFFAADYGQEVGKRRTREQEIQGLENLKEAAAAILPIAKGNVDISAAMNAKLLAPGGVLPPRIKALMQKAKKGKATGEDLKELGQYKEALLGPVGGLEVVEPRVGDKPERGFPKDGPKIVPPGTETFEGPKGDFEGKPVERTADDIFGTGEPVVKKAQVKPPKINLTQEQAERIVALNKQQRVKKSAPVEPAKGVTRRDFLKTTAAVAQSSSAIPKSIVDAISKSDSKTVKISARVPNMPFHIVARIGFTGRRSPKGSMDIAKALKISGGSSTVLARMFFKHLKSKDLSFKKFREGVIESINIMEQQVEDGELTIPEGQIGIAVTAMDAASGAAQLEGIISKRGDFKDFLRAESDVTDVEGNKGRLIEEIPLSEVLEGQIPVVIKHFPEIGKQVLRVFAASVDATGRIQSKIGSAAKATSRTTFPPSKLTIEAPDSPVETPAQPKPVSDVRPTSELPEGKGVEERSVKVFHGGEIVGGEIDPRFLGQGEGLAILGPGLYVSTNAHEAKKFFKHSRSEVLTEGNVDITNFLEVSKKIPEHLKEPLRKAAKAAGVEVGKDGFPSSERYSQLNDGRWPIGPIVKKVGKDSARKILVDVGIDGMREEIIPGEFELAIFNPSVFKFAKEPTPFRPKPAEVPEGKGVEEEKVPFAANISDVADGSSSPIGPIVKKVGKDSARKILVDVGIDGMRLPIPKLPRPERSTVRGRQIVGRLRSKIAKLRYESKDKEPTQALQRRLVSLERRLEVMEKGSAQRRSALRDFQFEDSPDPTATPILIEGEPPTFLPDTPIVIEGYHGSKSEIDKFDPSKIGTTDPGFLGRGVYFYVSPKPALQHGGAVNKRLLTIDKPLDVNRMEKARPGDQSSLYSRANELYTKVFSQELERNIREERSQGLLPQPAYWYARSTALQAVMKTFGFDGAVKRGNKRSTDFPYTEVVVLEGSQISKDLPSGELASVPSIKRPLGSLKEGRPVEVPADAPSRFESFTAEDLERISETPDLEPEDVRTQRLTESQQEQVARGVPIEEVLGTDVRGKGSGAESIPGQAEILDLVAQQPAFRGEVRLRKLADSASDLSGVAVQRLMGRDTELGRAMKDLMEGVGAGEFDAVKVLGELKKPRTGVRGWKAYPAPSTYW